jgi:hypothetical protein
VAIDHRSLEAIILDHAFHLTCGGFRQGGGQSGETGKTGRVAL